MNTRKQPSAATPRDELRPAEKATPLQSVRLGSRGLRSVDARSLALIEPELFRCSTSFCMALHAEYARAKA